jgi:hypothetical protein
MIISSLEHENVASFITQCTFQHITIEILKVTLGDELVAIVPWFL